MAKKFFTILIIPDAASKFRKIVVPRFLPVAALVIVALFISGFFYFLDGYLTMVKQNNRLESLNREAQLERSRMGRLGERVEEMQTALERLSQFSSKLRGIVALDSTEETGKTAVGGPSESAVQGAKGALEKEKRSLLEKLEEDMNRLASKSLSQEESFNELIDFFTRKVDIILSTPSIKPTQGWLSSGFGYRTSPFTGKRQFHQGIDIATHYGNDVRASAGGIVIHAGRKQGFGKMVEIDHGNGFVTRYAHNSEILVKKRQRVSRGQTIAKVGDSGRTTGPHVHYEVQFKGVPVNPMKYIIDEVADARR